MSRQISRQDRSPSPVSSEVITTYISTSFCLTEPYFRAVFWYHLFLLRLLRNIKEAKSYLSNVAEILWHSPPPVTCSSSIIRGDKHTHTGPYFRAVFWYHLSLLRLLRNIKEAKSYLSNVAEILWHSPPLPHCSHYFSLTMASVLRQTRKLMLVSYFDSEGSPRKASQDSNTKPPQLI